MERLLLDPKEVYGFLPHARASDDVIRLIQERRRDILKDVPVFPIPTQYQQDSPYRFLLCDGNHRREGYERCNLLLPSALYEPKEKIEIERDDLSPFRAANHPRIFERLILIFLRRHEFRNDLES